MKISSILVTLFLLIATLTPVNAVTLRGLVTEVRDGKTVVVYSGGRSFTVYLLGVDAPDLKQDFGDASREHLAFLVLEKPVEVDFSQLEGDHVVGRLICNKLDIGLQVIRDGVAWNDKTGSQMLSEAQRQLYAEAEQLARNELRGLWQDGTPMPPWEWRRAQAAKLEPQPTYRKGSGRALQSEDLVVAGRSTVQPTGVASDVRLPKPTAKPFNAPGRDADFRPYLTQGRVSIVYFYANWCPACRKLTPLMDEVNARVPEMQVVFMDIDDWNTPVAQQYGVSFVPYLKIYDKSGSLVAEGKSAKAWLQQAMAQHN